MSEVQGKPRRKWYKKGGKSVRLVFWLTFLGCVAAMFWIVFAHEEPDASYISSYNNAQKIIQEAVTNYSGTHNGSLPTLNGTYTNANCLDCSVVNMSALLIANGGQLQRIPDGCHLSNSVGIDNCNDNGNLGCNAEWHYIWIVDQTGELYSYCSGPFCSTNNSGYQGVWP